MLGLRLAFVCLALATPASASDFIDADGHIATNLSGIACADLHTDCYVIDNEGGFAQSARVTPSNLLVPGNRFVELVPQQYGADVAIGERPKQGCIQGKDHFGVLDGEAVAVAPDGTYYFTGSHGCSRHNDGDQPSSAFLVVRMRDGVVERSFRLSEALMHKNKLMHDFAEKVPGGLSIEGLAAINGKLYFGFRSPKPWLLSVDADAVFAEDGDLDAHLDELDLANNLGIRDLAALPDGNLLVLAGPKDGSDAPFGLYSYVRPNSRLLGWLSSGQKDHPEGLLILGSSEVLVLRDGRPGGDPEVVAVALPP